METGIYKEVQDAIEDAIECKAFYLKHGRKEDETWYSGRLASLMDIQIRLEAHGLRYDEHGASGRSDGKASLEQQAEDAGEGFVKKDKWNKKLNKLLANDQDGVGLSKLARMERSIVMLELRVNALNEVIHKHNLL